MAKSVNTIIRNAAGKYLLQMRDGTEGICNPLVWNFFGGKLESTDQDPLVGAAREFNEELRQQSGPGDFQLLGTVGEGDELVHVCRYVGPLEWGDFTLQEGAGVGFFTKAELVKIPITEKTKLIIEKLL